ncbi:MAG: hypothetical protein XXXJIFNMEKO3_02291 [Candidatus Erwinia impunctatus]|nr:hypothetical protein XXXJIFNMEKO_02291 [Culicoides impunctatus]
MKTKIIPLLLGSLISLQSAAQSPEPGHPLTLSQADKLASDTLAACDTSKYLVAVTVMDKTGVPLVIKRMPGAGLHTVEASRMKAYTALATRTSSEIVMKNARENPDATHLANIPGFLLLAGGVPLRDAAGEILGAIGVGGAPGGHLDQQCALQSLDKNNFQSGLKN